MAIYTTSSRNHKPDPAQHPAKHQRRQEPRPRLVTRRNRRLHHPITTRSTPPRRAIPLTRAPRIIRRQRRALINKQGLYHTQGAHLLTDPIQAVPRAARGPMLAARNAVRAAIALLGCGLGGGFQPRHDGVVGEGRELGGAGEPAAEVGFEGLLVRVAGSLGVGGADYVFAGFFEHDVVFEEYGGGV